MAPVSRRSLKVPECFFHCLNQLHNFPQLTTFDSWHLLQVFHYFNGNRRPITIAVLKDTEDVIRGVVSR